MRPFAMEGAVYPSPNPVAFQASFGPPEGHAFSRPVSLDTPVRSGPRHCGQSAANAVATARVAIPSTAYPVWRILKLGRRRICIVLSRLLDFVAEQNILIPQV